MVHVVFIGLGIIYLGFTLFIIFALFREDQKHDRCGREAALQQTAMEDLGDQTDTTV